MAFEKMLLVVEGFLGGKKSISLFQNLSPMPEGRMGDLTNK